MKNILKEIEEKYPVDTILVNGEQVWPYLRIRYHFAYTAKTVGSYGEAKHDLQASGRSKPSRMLRFAKNALCGMRYGFRNWFRKYDYIVLTDNGIRRQVGGKYMNRFLDPIIDELGPARVLCIENTSLFPPPRTNQVYTKYVVSRSSLTLFSLVIMLLRRILLRRDNVVNKWIVDRVEADLGLQVNVTGAVEFFEATRKAFTYLFRIMRPNAILLTCYYGGNEAVIRAAKRLGIRVVEVQHGIIGKEHPAYNVQRDIDGSCFPDHLLVFGKRELATFDNSRFIEQANVHPVGSFYIDYIRANYTRDPQLSEPLSGYRKVVGVTLQWTLERRLISFICEAAKLDSSILYILIPRRPEEKAYSNMDLPRNVVVITDKNFYELMIYCDFHSTVNSTCALEAPSLGVQNILVDIDGLATQYYGRVLSDGRVTRFASTPEEYVDILKNFARLDKDGVCELHQGFFATNYHENIRNFVKTYLL